MTNRTQRTDLVLPGVGDSRVDHIAVEVMYGRLHAAVYVLETLGFKEARRVQAEWGTAVFVARDGSIPIQLTEPATASGQLGPTENHFAIMVDDPSLVAGIMEKQMHAIGHPVKLEEVSGGKIFVTLSSILTIPLELVPRT